MSNLNIKLFLFNPYGERATIAWDDKLTGVVIDPGFWNGTERDKFFGFIDDTGITIKAVLLTHGHFDHIYGVKDTVDRYKVPVYMSPKEKVVTEGAALFAEDMKMPVPDTSWETTDVDDGDILDFDGLAFKVIATPGHSPGSVSYLCEDSGDLFPGDCLFAGTIGNTAHRWGSYDDEIKSIMEKLMLLDSDTKVHPGHGCGTTIGYERMHNPFLEPFNEKDPGTGQVDGIRTDD